MTDEQPAFEKPALGETLLSVLESRAQDRDRKIYSMDVALRNWIAQEIRLANDYGRQCVDLQADGDELEAIREQFTGIPMASNRPVVRWDGAMAAFIAMNFR